jgi:plastocyanin
MPFPHRPRLVAAASAAACSLALLACGSGGGDTASGAPAANSATDTATTAAAPAAAATAKAATARVTLKDISFTPSTVKIKAGDSVVWIWKDHDVPHNVTFKDRHSTVKHQGGTYRLKFPAKGTFTYVCTIHPGMDGKVVVA